MLAPLLIAAAVTLPLGVWPETSGPPEATREGVEIYTAEPEDEFYVLAVLPLGPPAAAPDAATFGELAKIATRLGADAVLLLEELPLADIPDDVDKPLDGTGRYAAAAFLLFDCACEEESPKLARARASGVSHRGARAVVAGAPGFALRVAP